MRISRGILRGAPAAVKQGISAGRRPAPAVVPAAGRQPQKQQPKQQPKQQRVSCEEAGWVRLRGTA
ncbi:hypothetical protein MG068_18755 [Stenotrophomonas sp. ASS1]|nr:hypothetical protein MG068_18755 [Stenotrophomonas sp. ASS1]